MKCINCQSEIQCIDSELDIYECKECHLFSLNGNYTAPQNANTEEMIEESVYHLRKNNFRIITNMIKQIFSTNNNIVGLEVGCARGWFMEEAESAGIRMCGIEPEETFYMDAKEKGLNVIRGLFPDASIYHENEFNFIIFNDVFEHIPNLLMTLEYCRSLLKKNGLLIINAPSSDGILYKMSHILSMMGINMYWKRLWQVDFYSPHLWYFNSRNLNDFVGKVGFQNYCHMALSVVSRDGLRKRLFCNSNDSKFLSYVAFYSLYLGIPFLQFLPADIMCNFYIKK